MLPPLKEGEQLLPLEKGKLKREENNLEPATNLSKDHV
jgi:hypothetical protein